jgi:hypothetical protein
MMEETSVHVLGGERTGKTIWTRNMVVSLKLRVGITYDLALLKLMTSMPVCTRYKQDKCHSKGT